MNKFVLSVSRCLIPAFVTACFATGSLAQSGPPGGLGVNVLNNPLSVIVTNPPSQSTNAFIVNPGDIAKAEGIQNPVTLQDGCQFGNGNFCGVTFNVPAKQRFVIEYASVHCNQPPANQMVGVSIFTQTAGGHVTSDLTTDHSGALTSGNIRVVSFGQMLRLYADPGSTITVQGQTSDATQADSIIGCSYSLTGQFVNVP